MKLFALFIFSILFTSPIRSQEKEKNDSSKRQEIKLIDITQEKEDRPPVANFDLRLFNIFVLNSKTIYYYFNSSFIPQKEFDEYRFENLEISFLHKTDLKHLKNELNKLVVKQRLEENTVVFAVKDQDQKIVNLFFKEIFHPLGIEHVQVGFITDELLTILKTIR